MATHALQQQLLTAINSLNNNNGNINTVSSSSFTVVDTASIILPSNPNRLLFLVTNTGSEPLYLDFDSDPTANVFSFLLYEKATLIPDFNFLGTIHALSTATGTNAVVKEFFNS
ncbi:MAG: hypothetical protein ACOC1X_02950 [Promethearchaeota archaeon]